MTLVGGHRRREIGILAAIAAGAVKIAPGVGGRRSSARGRNDVGEVVWCYHRFGLSFRSVEDRLAERGVTLTDETIRQWTAHLQRFASVHGVMPNLFRVGRHLLRAVHHRLLRTQACLAWNAVTCPS